MDVMCYIFVTLVLLFCNTFALDLKRESVEWGTTLALSAGSYIFYKSGPFFDEPLLEGSTDKPLTHETVPTTWLISVSALTAAGTMAIPPESNDFETRYHYAKGLVQAFAVNSFLTTLGKDITGRYRPNADARMAANYDEHKLRDSFPSGHSSTSFAVASYLSLYIWEATAEGGTSENIGKALLTAVLIGSAGWIGYTRIEDNAHRPDEVLTGAALGTVVGVGAFYYQHSNIRKEAQSGAVSASPIGISFTWRF
jgi:membrane-associated phospholipid phosphatase